MVTINDNRPMHDKEYKGLSTDTKPVHAEPNELFWELDTDKFYYFNGQSWAEVGTTANNDSQS